MNRKKRIILAALVILMTSAAVGASAASLGTLTTPTLGASDATVSPCTVTGATVTYVNTYSGTSGTYNTTQISVTGLTTCSGLNIRAAVANGTPAGVDSTAVVVSGAGAALLTLLGGGTPSKNITGVSLVVTT